MLRLGVLFPYVDNNKSCDAQWTHQQPTKVTMHNGCVND
jgi:hypothetical protein